MITLGTGLPGNGKTLFMLWYLKKKAEKENREVFYHNIKNLNTEVLTRWHEFDPTKWMDLPNGCIVVIDECQEVFPVKPNGAVKPDYYEELAKHRHRGMDFFIITQHPTLIDNFVRRLVGQHFHSIRKFGMSRSTIYEWSSCVPSPENAASQKNAVTLKWAFPKEVFGWYKSAEVHTVKRAVPMKLVLAVLFVVAVPAIGYWALTAFQGRYDKGEHNEMVNGVSPAAGTLGNQPTVLSTAAVAPAAGGLTGGAADPIGDLKNYTWERTPRVAGLPQTAPVYDPLTTPTRVPVPAMCVQVGKAVEGKSVSCKCYSQQATPIEVDFNMCIEFARNGFFRDFDADRDRQQTQQAAASSAVLAQGGVRDVSLRDPYGSGQVVALNDSSSPSLAGSRPPPNLDDGPPPTARATRTAVVPSAPE